MSADAATSAQEWTPERVADLAPDAQVASAGLKLARSGTWTREGHSATLLWGLCQGSGSRAYQVCVDLVAPAFRCSCPSRKFPCKHAVGLLHRLSTGDVKAGTPADFAQEWADKRAAKAQAKAAKAAGGPDTDPTATARRTASAKARATRRERRLTEGLAELELWLADQVAQGLATGSAARRQALRTFSSRMVDAQAPGLATRLSQMTLVREDSPDWTQTLTAALGEVHLLTQAWRHRTALPPELLAAVHRALGVPVKSDDVLATPQVHDQWVVMGSLRREEERVTAQHVWLLGASGRWAQVLTYDRRRAELPRAPGTGTALTGGLHFYPFSHRVVEPQGQWEQPSGWSPTPLSVAGAHAAWRDALAADPWAIEEPVLVTGRIGVDDAGSLCLVDDAGPGAGGVGPESAGAPGVAAAGPAPATLPLRRALRHANRVAVSAGDDAVVAGLLSQEGLWPLSVLARDEVVEI